MLREGGDLHSGPDRAWRSQNKTGVFRFRGFPSQPLALLCHPLPPQAGVPSGHLERRVAFPLSIKMELRRALGEYSGPEATGHFKQERVLCSVPDGQGYLLGMRRNLEVWRDWGNLLIIIREQGGVNLLEKCSKAVWRAVSRVHCAPLPWRLSAVDSVHCVDCSGLNLGREEVKNG